MFRRKGRKKSKVHRVQYLRVILKPGVWKRVPMKLLKWGRKMASTRRYDLVPNDDYDTRIPMHPEVAFEYGISFHAKYIGTMDVPRPSSRVEIVAAMRRVRYEFRAKGVKKRQVTFRVSVDGVRVTTVTNVSNQKRTRFFSRKKKAPECIEIMNHPIYRIFYVSHDSSDLKIFSYIARDGATNAFKCNVFKSNKKSQAMRIVRTVGQAFEVCHKAKENTPDNPVPSTSSAPDEVVTIEHVCKGATPKEPASECGASGSGGASTSKAADEPKGNRSKHIDPIPPPPKKEGKRSAQTPKPVPSINLPDLPECVTKVETTKPPEGDASTPLSAQHQLKLLQERLEQQSQQTRAAVAQLLLFRDQLAAEQAARCEAQARTHQLLVHNKELLDHIAALVAHLQEKEKGNHRPINAQQLTLLPQIQTEGNEAIKTETTSVRNGNCEPYNSDALINIIAQNKKMYQNVENNNINSSNTGVPAKASDKTNDSSTTPNIGNMNNEQMQKYLISKFQEMTVGKTPAPAPEAKSTDNKYFFQNCKAFPHIPPLISEYSDSELASLLNQQFADKSSSSDEFGNMAQAMSIGHSENSSSDSSSSSKDSSDSSTTDEILPYIMPLSHNGTLTATGEDGRVRVIVPVSPSPSTSGVGEAQAEAKQPPTGATLKVPGQEAPGSQITRSTSERVANRSDLMETLRGQWTRHTTK